MFFNVIADEIEYCIFGELRRAIKGQKVHIPVRSVAVELLRQKRVEETYVQGRTLEEIANPAKIEAAEKKPTLKVGSLVRIKDVEEVGTVLEILKKQVKVEYSSGETKRVAKSRIEEILD